MWLSKVRDVTIVKEMEEVLVITTTVGNNVELKFCFEISKDLEENVAVTERFLSEEKAYQEVITTLDKGFDASKFIKNKQSDFIWGRDTITENNYESIKDLFLNISRIGSMANTKEDVVPVLPPRKPLVSNIKSVPLTTHVVLERPAKRQQAMTTKGKHGLKPAILPRHTTKSSGHSAPVEPYNISEIPPKTPLKAPSSPKNAADE